MVKINPNISTATLNVNYPNIPIKRWRLTELIKKIRATNYMPSIRNPPEINPKTQAKSKGMEKETPFLD